MSPHDILALRGLEELTDYIVDGIQEVYRLQGVSINDKHIEVILNQMLRKVVITEPGDSEFIIGEQAEYSKVKETNLALRKDKKAEIDFELIGSNKMSNLFDGKAQSITKDIIFKIKENEKIKLRNIYFEGNETYSDFRLRFLMKETKQQRWYYFWRTAFDKDKLDTDKEKVIPVDKLAVRDKG